MAAAEIAAGAYIASEVVEHGAQLGYAAYLVSKPTLPLKATFKRIATTSGDQSQRSLARSNHTVTVIGNKAYIFGGNTATNILASNDVHAITLEHSGEPEMDYSMIPALSTFEGERTPAGRANHAACAFHGSIAVYGGCSEKGDLIDENSSIWLFNPERKAWDLLAPSDAGAAPGARQNAQLFAQEGYIVLFGGIDGSSSHASDLWQFDVASRSWTQLPTAPVGTSNAALSDGQLWLISGSDPMSSQLHHLSISASDDKDPWESFTFPTNPLAPGPRARHHGALLPISTGWGRNYLIYLLGARDDQSSATSPTSPDDLKHSKEATQWSDTWVLQIPSSDLEAKASLTLKNAIKPAKIKDAIRSAIGADTGHLSWAEAVVQVPDKVTLEEEDGSLHPGPRAFFGADVMQSGSSVVFWGGVNAKGERVGDGWVVKFE
ncbi:galactose oxidase [Cucurbitaria berberidis CBS 394.84]|uniref:Galactose oxidase n=1 Tax=Cucurbitaria berberidis CBS 394.84 TaxID=1168544 RepID=A0A9P4GJQ6_9PLEO|nr:galactose oxidase [Cucurbitaria berberidis CBS 394.84]KAF1847533.1 galactose oxidase [Cucurbitaria berberidis CBS 394.84]